ncbi:hypothetical protein BDV95DRAFT_509104, partial [Massariosphaeria phaeospora]
QSAMASTNATVAWVPEPHVRGTMGLLWSCFTTIFICTWSAIHPNLPAAGEIAARVLSRRIGYVLLSLVALEIVTFVAIMALLDARAMKAESLKRCFLLKMGGFIVEQDISARNMKVLQRILPSELWRLLQTGALPWSNVNIDDQDIDDRSKADWIVKLLALAQILWFSAQLIGRSVQNLSVTMLELFTVAIVYCASITYLV